MVVKQVLLVWEKNTDPVSIAIFHKVYKTYPTYFTRLPIYKNRSFSLR